VDRRGKNTGVSRPNDRRRQEKKNSGKAESQGQIREEVIMVRTRGMGKSDVDKSRSNEGEVVLRGWASENTSWTSKEKTDSVSELLTEKKKERVSEISNRGTGKRTGGDARHMLRLSRLKGHHSNVGRADLWLGLVYKRKNLFRRGTRKIGVKRVREKGIGRRTNREKTRGDKGWGILPKRTAAGR